jgi:double-stranded uracil-DNA glycosylase
MRTLPDLLRPGLALVFVGINPGERSAARGHYYAHPGNGFWPSLSASPLVDRPVTFEDDRRLPLELGIGLTDVVKRVISDSQQVTNDELRLAVPSLRARIAYASPRAVCFTTTRGFEACFPGAWRAGGWGAQGVTLEGAAVWVMPSPSGRAIAHRSHVGRVLAELGASLDIDRRVAPGGEPGAVGRGEARVA